jgi:hypothetical protein
MREMTLAGFIGHLTASVAELKAHEHHAMERAARLVEARAKAEIGHYQTDTAPFPAWAELADATKDDRERHGFTENDPGLRTGEMRDSIGRVVDDHEAVIGSDDEKLVYFELGTVHQPPRSVLGAAAHQTAERVAEIVGAGVVKALVGENVVNGLLPIPD